MNRLSQIRERAEAAMLGPWKHSNQHDGQMVNTPIEDVEFIPRFDDARFIAFAHEDIPWLLSEIDRLNEQLEYCKNSFYEILAEALKAQKKVAMYEQACT